MISEILGTSSFELIRDRIGEILADEFASQANLTIDEDLEVTVWLERFVPFSFAEPPAINITLLKSDFDLQTQLQSNGIHRFGIDVYAQAKANEDNVDGDADKLSTKKLHKIMGVARGILEHSVYKRLGFDAPFIMNRHVESISVVGNGKETTNSETVGRLVFVVRVAEENGVVEPVSASGYDTQVKLDLTDKGYRWQLDSAIFDLTFDATFD